MAVINAAQISVPTAAKYAQASFEGRYEFDVMTRRLERSVHLVEKPLAFARVLQRLRQPTWYMEYRDRPITQAFRHGLSDAIMRLGATLVQHSNMRRHNPDAQSIALRWHSQGRKERIFHYKEAYLPHMTHFDRDGYSGWSEIAAAKKSLRAEYPEPAVADAFFAEDVRPFLAQRRSKFAQSEEAFDVEPGFVFVPLQVLNDAVIALKHEEDYLTSLGHVLGFLHARGMRLVLKRHPQCRAPEMAAFLRQMVDSQMAVSTTASIHDIIPRAQGVVTMNSGVGFEALLYEKPVVLLGRADYAEMAFALTDTRSGEAAMQKALDFLRAGEAPAGLRQHLFVMLRKYQVDSRSEDAFDRALLRALCVYHLETPMAA
ncbi:MAG: hypothetical protein K5Q68_11035 [Roseococcus sp.]|nr:hypothetical protein [Roseococcus sp.]